MSVGNGHPGIHGQPTVMLKSEHGKFLPGTIPPKSTGRPRGAVSWERELELSVRRVEKARKRPFLDHAVDRAFKSDRILPHVLDKLVANRGEEKESGGAAQVVINMINFQIGAPTV